MSWQFKELGNDWEVLIRGDLSGLHVRNTKTKEEVEIPYEWLVEQIIYHLRGLAHREVSDRVDSLKTLEDFVK
jgi:hypothetical protein